MMNLIVWGAAILGLIVGLIGYAIAKRAGPAGMAGYLAAGAVAGFLGGVLGRALIDDPALNVSKFVAASLIGAVLASGAAVIVVNLLTRKTG